MEKLATQKKEVQQSRGLVLVEDPQLAKIMERKGLKSARARRIEYGESYYTGKQDGAKIDVRRGITADPKQSQLGLGPGKKDK